MERRILLPGSHLLDAFVPDSPTLEDFNNTLNRYWDMEWYFALSIAARYLSVRYDSNISQSSIDCLLGILSSEISLEINSVSKNFYERVQIQERVRQVRCLVNSTNVAQNQNVFSEWYKIFVSTTYYNPNVICMVMGIATYDKPILVDYVRLPSKMVVLFRDQWLNLTSSRQDDDTGIVEVMRGAKMGENDPFVIAKCRTGGEKKKGTTRATLGSHQKEILMQVPKQDHLFYGPDMFGIQRDLQSQPEHYKHVDTPSGSPIQHTEADPWLTGLYTRYAVPPDSIPR
ncbi:hypothetical protein CRG98_000995 [Punica granatum]|uniref:Uncharacterized protein n=1 Tax=Punica granatum TaxID=22663 RepID=A0A2I0LD59_PUNGR|nr:hypothetical protein CRG98_000995 [Punica granatum]